MTLKTVNAHINCARSVCYRMLDFNWLAELNVRTLNRSAIFMKEKDVLSIYIYFCFFCA
jgi:hypothetical protein